MKALLTLLWLFVFCGVASGQVSTFSTTLSAVNLPGSGGSTMAGTIAGLNLKITENFALRQTSLISSGAATNGFFGGGNYTLPVLSKKLNDISPNLNGYDFQFQVTGSVGALRVSDATGNVHSNWAALFGGRVNYAIKGSKTYGLAVEIQDLYASRALPHKNNLLVALGPTIRF